MKKLLFFLAIVLAGLHTYAQNTVKKYQLPVIYLPANVSVHFISPEPIQYVDISSKNLIGDLPIKNVLRLRLKDSVSSADAIITIAGEKFMAQYQVFPADSVTARDAVTNIEIQPADMRPLDISAIGLSQPQLKTIALRLFCKNTKHPIEKTKAFGLKASLYHLYTAGDYIFLDVGYTNKTNLNYAIDEFRFKINDKKITKATNVQSVELKPEFILFEQPSFQHTYRNIIVLKKISFPGNKVLHIELNEKQISGRVITLEVSYKAVLDADIVPF